MTTAEAAATERMAALVASTRAAQAESAQAGAVALVVANDQANPANWPLSPRMRRFAGTFARGFSYTGQTSRLAALDEGVSE